MAIDIDMEQFKAIFLEESREGLDTMESELLEMSPGEAESDSIGTIFRAAHSIKGGAATFGLESIAGFTHVVETLLDEIRSGERAVTRDAIDLFLNSIDCIRDMLDTDQEGNTVDQDRLDEVSADLDRMLGSNTPPVSMADDPEYPEHSGGWTICFKPMPDMLRTGNDVVRMFRELSELGDLEVIAETQDLPPLVDMDPELVYTAWNLTLLGDIEKPQIDEIFAWVEDECELSIETIRPDDELPDNTATDTPVRAVEPPVERRIEGDRRQKPTRGKSAVTETSSIRVDINKVDDLINMVGELVITQSMLGQLGEDFDIGKLERLRGGLVQLERNTRELQESVMRLRMLPISFAFNRFPRMVHDLSAKLGKKIELILSGEQTELDKTVMEKIGDPLVHLVRNAIDHGIETPDQRRAAGKPETGVVGLDAYHQGGNIVIEITDDGAGLDRDRIRAKAIDRGMVTVDEELTDDKIYDLLFQPGFSTAESVSDLSGRGVGMDVVRRNIMALGGSVSVTTEMGKGSTFTIRLPLTLAILDGQLIQVGGQTFIVPLISIIESLLVDKEQVNALEGKAELYRLRDEYLPIVRLHRVFGIGDQDKELSEGLLVVVDGDAGKVGIFVDDLLGQQQVVIKSLETNYRQVNGLAGATILGDGTVALIVDITGIIQLSKNKSCKQDNTAGDHHVA